MGKTQSDTLQEAYWDRNQAVMVLALLAQEVGFRVWRKEDPLAVEWPILFVELPTGQVSWHIPKVELDKYPWSSYDREWDGHSLAEKQGRMAAFIKLLSDQQADSSARGGGLW